MKIGVIGANGFIGQVIYDRLPEKDRRRIVRGIWENVHYDVIIDANGSSMKYLAQSDPSHDFKVSVDSVVHYTTRLKYDKYIYISSIDAELPTLINYGFNRSIAEQVVMHYANNWTIIRLCSVIGPEAKKGIVYDVLNDNKLFVTKDSLIQIISVYSAARRIIRAALHGDNYKIIKAYSKGCISVNKICDVFGKDPDVDPTAETQYYDEVGEPGFLTPEKYLNEAFYERMVKPMEPV
ncbi:MAG: hypothetical protein ACW98I_21025 [Candidatus Hodarchaeales archaeon]|jgi:dTDP-4-dehydrorhamnose reductase